MDSTKVFCKKVCGLTELLFETEEFNDFEKAQDNFIKLAIYKDYITYITKTPEDEFYKIIGKEPIANDRYGFNQEFKKSMLVYSPAYIINFYGYMKKEIK